MTEPNPYESPSAPPEKSSKQIKARERWLQTRARGRTRYILLAGVLGWGVSTAVVWSAIMGWSGGVEGFLSYLAIAIVLFPAGGYFYGAWMWRNMAEKFGTESLDASHQA